MAILQESSRAVRGLASVQGGVSGSGHTVAMGVDFWRSGRSLAIRLSGMVPMQCASANSLMNNAGSGQVTR